MMKQHNTRLYDRIFPLKLYEDTYYKYTYGASLKVSEKLYLAIYDKCKNVRDTEIIMRDILSKSSISQIRKNLTKLGILDIRKLSPQELKDFCIKNSHKGSVCEWCGQESFILHSHHYPVLKSKGGTKTVNICPNCHSTYHYLIGGKTNGI